MTIAYHDETQLELQTPSSVGTDGSIGAAEGSKPRFTTSALIAQKEDWTELALGDRPSIETIPKFPDLSRSPLEERFRRARANALMDPACLYLLHKFRLGEYIDINELDQLIAGPAGWIKVCLLVRADLVEIVGSDLRITQQGRESIEKTRRILNQSG
jgi:hypothetical protein